MTTGTEQHPQDQTAPPVQNGKKRQRRRKKMPDSEALARLDFESGSGFALAQRMATALACSSIIPEDFQGPPGSRGWGNTLVALELAHRLKFPPLLVMQNLVLIDGKPSWQGAFYVALIQAGGQFKDFDWEWRGDANEPDRDDRGARFQATRVSDSKLCLGQWITVKMAKAKGWWSKKDSRGVERSHWPTMTDQMLAYRSASFWTRQWNPAATLGLQTTEELMDTREDERLVAPSPPLPAGVPRTATETLAAGIDPPSMETAAVIATPELPTSEPEQLQAIRNLLSKGDRRAAIEAVRRLPQHLQKAGTDIYNGSSGRGG